MMEIFVENNYEDPKHCAFFLINWMLSSDVIPYEIMVIIQDYF